MNELSLYILDIVENSLSAGSHLVDILLSYDTLENYLVFQVIDDGKGMDKETLTNALTPFYTTRKTRKFGFGLPFLKELCEMCEGSLNVTSEVGVGTKLCATFKANHIDLPPIGNLSDTMYILITNPENVRIKFTYMKNAKIFSFDTKEIEEILDGVSIKEPAIHGWFMEFMKEGQESLN